MTGPSGFFAAGTIVAIFVVVAVLVMWRMRKHVASRADAEARMAAAMQELQMLAARLETQRERSGAADELPGGGSRDATSST
jgi:type II secretory pathway pseudopilin PulG